MFKKSAKVVGIILAINVLVLAIICIFVIGYMKNNTNDSWEEHRGIETYGLLEDGTNVIEYFENTFESENSIWPEKIDDEMDVKDYLLIHYNPFDSNYLGYLVVEYNKEDYDTEVQRLSEYLSTEYIGQYGAKGFEKYEVLAMQSSYSGFVYAITNKEGMIIYVAMIFPGYGMDIDYREYIPDEYLPEGLEVGKDNPTRKKMMENFQRK